MGTQETNLFGYLNTSYLDIMFPLTTPPPPPPLKFKSLITFYIKLEHLVQSKLLIETSLYFRLKEFKYTSQETYLNITNLKETKYFTCTFKFDVDNSVQYTVSALQRPTSKSTQFIIACLFSLLFTKTDTIVLVGLCSSKTDT